MGSSSLQSRNRRIDVDVMKLLTSNFKVELIDDNMQEFIVEFPGPKETPYEGGVWLVRVSLPADYPYKSPSIGFSNRIFHPNVEESQGTVCLDVINETWTPIYGLLNVFESFLPQLLAYPNAADPLNHTAATLWKQSERDHSNEYNEAVRRYVQKYAMGRNKSEKMELDQRTADQKKGEKEKGGAGWVSHSAATAPTDEDELSEMSSLDEQSDDGDM